ncbi:Deoxyribodipyrimidine photo-lyase [Thalassoglobus neptunius]|uniref:Deoxyribodipyrimidine photo-lyase n=1 Tax=Thalassoglobus neptunius TaxID=1938619 RepID=A0A5C5W099_9PLAN|nr:deoxyribodipyrimidine photolyase [Thalassoglobus neptunius]TWT43595.1 Deoxyribodipyrimidine photo-lyase [Thalassoglobus neptunius]
MSDVPTSRIQSLNDEEVQENGDYVLYWMIANRRAKSNFSLQRAVEWANLLNKPLIVFEALRVNYRWASDRIHRFVLQGMADQKRDFADANVTYYPYVEPTPNHGRELLTTLADKAAVVVTDDFPSFFIPTMLRLISRKLHVKLEAVDSNGLFPMRSTEEVFKTAYSFRRFLQKSLPPHLEEFPDVDPIEANDLPNSIPVPKRILKKWPTASADLLKATSKALSELPIDHSVGPADFEGGRRAADDVLDRFIEDRLVRYGDGRNHPDEDASSGLSPYLHFGQISSHTVFQRIADHEGWSIDQLSDKTSGAREGWWGMSSSSESFLDELITWRELGYNMCAHRSDYDRYESLPDWAKKTLEEHAHDDRPHTYSLEEFERAETHDEIWNAAQRQLVRDGRLHNYLRMLWGKKIFQWSATPRDALKVMIELNNKYAVDGRNPNSYSGIFWVLGRYDRAWGPERPIFGKIRYMTSESTRKKLKMTEYLEKYSE